MNGPFSAGQYALGIVLGFALGLLFGYCNMCITRSAVKKNGGNGLSAIAATQMARSLVNVLALALVFFTRNLVPLPCYAIWPSRYAAFRDRCIPPRRSSSARYPFRGHPSIR